MFLRCTKRKKAGKEHHYWSLVENKRVGGGRVVQRHVLYLGEINDSQQEAWRKSIEIFEEGKTRPTTVALFPEERMGPVDDAILTRHTQPEPELEMLLRSLKLELPPQPPPKITAGNLPSN